tara:strand:+ start:9316 stop:9561 length:246 start_codon:yes stop_codon:yes gene_type:complete
MKLKAVHCLGCGDKIYSRAPHDFRHCSCGQVYVDGGRSYFKYGANPEAEFKTTEVDIDVPLSELYEDWNEMSDNYGIIHAA